MEGHQVKIWLRWHGLRWITSTGTKVDDDKCRNQSTWKIAYCEASTVQLTAQRTDTWSRDRASLHNVTSHSRAYLFLLPTSIGFSTCQSDEESRRFYSLEPPTHRSERQQWTPGFGAWRSPVLPTFFCWFREMTCKTLASLPSTQTWRSRINALSEICG